MITDYKKFKDIRTLAIKLANALIKITEKLGYDTSYSYFMNGLVDKEELGYDGIIFEYMDHLKDDYGITMEMIDELCDFCGGKENLPDLLEGFVKRLLDMNGGIDIILFYLSGGNVYLGNLPKLSEMEMDEAVIKFGYGIQKTDYGKLFLEKSFQTTGANTVRLFKKEVVASAMCMILSNGSYGYINSYIPNIQIDKSRQDFYKKVIENKFDCSEIGYRTYESDSSNEWICELNLDKFRMYLINIYKVPVSLTVQYLCDKIEEANNQLLEMFFKEKNPFSFETDEDGNDLFKITL